MTDKLLDFCEKRKSNIETKRRNFERIVFRNMLGAYTVIHKNGAIFPVDLVDISHDGCQFQVPWNGKAESKFEKEIEIMMRFYFTKNSYIPAVMTIRYGNEYIEEGRKYMQYGCEFDKSMPSFEALESFIDFMYRFAEHSTLDRGDAKAFFY